MYFYGILFLLFKIIYYFCKEENIVAIKNSI